MSRFPGFIDGYPDVAVDRFTDGCLEKRYLFLSHCHTDHMEGLDSPALLAALAAPTPTAQLFCSRQSAALLSSWPKYRRLSHFLRALDVGEPCQLSAGVSVTALSAGHCPGSVMLLFEAGDGDAALYTGDCRLSRDQLASMPALHTAGGTPKPMRVLYADTTFCAPGRRELPGRQRSTAKVVQLACQWLALGPRHRVNVVCKARYGYEHLFRELFEATGQRVHVGANKHAMYERLPDIGHFLTGDSSATRLHSCWEQCVCLGDSLQLRTIIVSTLFFFLNQSVDCMLHKVQGWERYRVLYSCHGSLSEVVDMVHYLRPEQVVPCVTPPGWSADGVAALLNADGGGDRSTKVAANVATVSDGPALPALLGRGSRPRPPADESPGWVPLGPLNRQTKVWTSPARKRRLSESQRKLEPASKPELQQEPQPGRHAEPRRRLGRSQAAPVAVDAPAAADERPPWVWPFDSDED